MGLIYDPSEDDAIAELFRRVDALERMAPTGHSSVTTGQFRIASIDGLLVEGQERVTGILVVDGSLQVTGTQTVSGTLVIGGGQIINGTFTINGTTTINGNTTYVGDVAVTGTLNLTGTFNVTGGGKITVDGGVPLVIQNGLLTFASGGEVQGTANGVRLAAPDASITAASSAAAMQGGSTVLAVTDSGVATNADLNVGGDIVAQDDLFLIGLPVKTGTGQFAGLLWCDPSDGQLYRIVS